MVMVTGSGNGNVKPPLYFSRVNDNDENSEVVGHLDLPRHSSRVLISSLPASKSREQSRMCFWYGVNLSSPRSQYRRQVLKSCSSYFQASLPVAWFIPAAVDVEVRGKEGRGGGSGGGSVGLGCQTQRWGCGWSEVVEGWDSRRGNVFSLHDQSLLCQRLEDGVVGERGGVADVEVRGRGVTYSRWLCLESGSNQDVRTLT